MNKPPSNISISPNFIIKLSKILSSTCVHKKIRRILFVYINMCISCTSNYNKLKKKKKIIFLSPLLWNILCNQIYALLVEQNKMNREKARENYLPTHAVIKTPIPPAR